MAIVLPFPRVRDRAFVRRHAARMASLSHRAAEKHLACQLRVQVETMRKRGVDPELIEAQRRDLETAIRSHLAFCARSHPTGGAA